MGYQTDFEGEFKITPKLKIKDSTFLTKLANTRRMARNVDAKYGVEGEFFVDGSGEYGQDMEDKTILNYNEPPKTQPGLWCCWEPTEDGSAIAWNGAEKFYNYVEWIKYLIAKVLAPRGYKLNGEVSWFGEEDEDKGIIIIRDNVVTVRNAEPVSYGPERAA